MQDPANEFPRTLLLGSSMNKASSFTASPTGNKGIVALGKAEDVPTMEVTSKWLQ